MITKRLQNNGKAMLLKEINNITKTKSLKKVDRSNFQLVKSAQKVQMLGFLNTKLFKTKKSKRYT